MEHGEARGIGLGVEEQGAGAQDLGVAFGRGEGRALRLGAPGQSEVGLAAEPSRGRGARRDVAVAQAPGLAARAVNGLCEKRVGGIKAAHMGFAQYADAVHLDRAAARGKDRPGGPVGKEQAVGKRKLALRALASEIEAAGSEA
ncbi:hypothetical protein [Novosphingobium sp. MBES04]|uniref:hypothetical protein n=1 Tax=Novosphingobium sp. MBES04 TaxID=1206458 RepID=UPI0007234E71|nr:hypothetical protein [Novosphingobium sp. MBES04]GAM03490.1 hypothetical protein MBENS4_0489 [Novosphingobium sp. MBES04]